MQTKYTKLQRNSAHQLIQKLRFPKKKKIYELQKISRKLQENLQTTTEKLKTQTCGLKLQKNTQQSHKNRKTTEELSPIQIFTHRR